jgi:hypothetical protein
MNALNMFFHQEYVNYFPLAHPLKRADFFISLPFAL